MNEQELFELVRNCYAETNKDYLIKQCKKACENCPKNPKNGGDGICHCILGTPKIT